MTDDVGIVIQGPSSYVNQIIECYGGVPNCVFSTWNDEPRDNIVLLNRHRFDFIQSPKPDHTGFGNANLQCLSTYNGIRYLTSKSRVSKILKIRSDMVISNIDLFLQCAYESLQDNAIAFIGYFKSPVSSICLMDFINTGRAEEMLKFWKPDLQQSSGLPYPEVWLQSRYFNKQTDVSWEQFFNQNPPAMIKINRTNSILWLKHGWDISDNLVMKYRTNLSGHVNVVDEITREATIKLERIPKLANTVSIMTYMQKALDSMKEDWCLWLVDEEIVDFDLPLLGTSDVLINPKQPVYYLRVYSDANDLSCQPRLVKRGMPVQQITSTPQITIPATIRQSGETSKSLLRALGRIKILTDRNSRKVITSWD